jgi:hypothetical protein
MRRCPRVGQRSSALFEQGRALAVLASRSGSGRAEGAGESGRAEGAGESGRAEGAGAVAPPRSQVPHRAEERADVLASGKVACSPSSPRSRNGTARLRPGGSVARPAALGGSARSLALRCARRPREGAVDGAEGASGGVSRARVAQVTGTPGGALGAGRFCRHKAGWKPLVPPRPRRPAWAARRRAGLPHATLRKPLRDS